MLIRNTLARIAGSVGLALAAATTALGVAGSSNAAPLDQVFLDRLNSVGITTSNPYATVLYAQGVCRQLGLGTPHSRIVDFVLNDNASFDRDGAGDYVVLAYMTYCPEFR